MGFIDEIKKDLVDVLPENPCFKAVLFGESVGYFEFVSGIKSYSGTEIVVFVKRGELKICGENLYIKKLCEGDLVVVGKIKAVERV